MMSETIGQQLQQARQAHNISLEQASQATRLRIHYLRALEEDDLAALPSMAQGRGFLRSYAQYLGIDPGPLLETMDPAKQPGPAPKKPEPAPQTEPELDDSSDRIFREIGNNLRAHREMLGLSLEDVERHTHLRLHYLESLEKGRMDNLPSPVQARGMLSNYTAFLGMDTESLLLRFADALQLQLANRQAAAAAREAARARVRPASPRPQAWLLRVLPTDLIVTALFLIGIGAFMVWGLQRVNAIQAQQQAEASPPAVVDVLTQNTATPTLGANAGLQLSPTPDGNGNPSTGVDPVTPTITQVPPTLNPAPVQVYVVARQRTWMRVIVDGNVAFEGRVAVGSAYLYSADQRVELLTGNAAALQVYFNRQDLGPLGIFGQVVTRIYTRQGAETPTPTATPEGLQPPTSTPDINATTTPSPSPEVTATPRP